MQSDISHTYIREAIIKDDHSFLEIIIGFIEGVIDERDQDGNTHLHLAAKLGHDNCVKILLDNGAQSLINNEGETPLGIAVNHNNIKVVKALLEGGADVHSIDSHGKTALHIAATNGHAEVAKLLLEKGAWITLDFIDKDRNSPLHLAAKNGHAEVIEALIKEKAITNLENSEGKTALQLAKMNNNTLAINALQNALQKTKNDEDNIKDLLEAAKDGDVIKLNALIAGNAKINLNAKGAPGLYGDKGWGAIHIAAAEGRSEFIKILLKNQARLNEADKDVNSPLHLAAQFGHFDSVKILLENGAEINQFSKGGRTPLHDALLGGHINIVELLLKKGAKIDLTNNQGESALHVAINIGIETDNTNAFKILLQNGVDVNLVATKGNYQGFTPIEAVALLSNVKEDVKKELIEGLFKNGAKKISEKHLETVLNDGGDSEPIKKLLEEISQPNAIKERDEALRENKDLIKVHAKSILNGNLTLDTAKLLILDNEIFGDVIVNAIKHIIKEEKEELAKIKKDPQKFEKIQKSGFATLIETNNSRDNNEATKVMLKNPKEFRVFCKTISDLLSSQSKKDSVNPFSELHELLPNIVIGLLPPKLKEELQHLSESSTLQFIGDLLKASSSKINEIKRRPSANSERPAESSSVERQTRLDGSSIGDSKAKGGNGIG